jgi:hypothetical protein
VSSQISLRAIVNETTEINTPAMMSPGPSAPTAAIISG